MSAPTANRLEDCSYFSSTTNVLMRGHRFHMAKSHLRVVAPTEVKRTVAPKRAKNAELRTREHFTPDEVEALIEAARGNRYGHRDATLILLTYRRSIIRGRQKRNLTACVPNHHSDFTSGGMGSSNYGPLR
jgi:hypothetical protein